MSSHLTIVRAAHLLDYITVMRKFGAPVDRELAGSSLPTWIEESPDDFVSVPMAIEWISRCGRDVEPMELGFLAAQNASLDSLKPSHQQAILGAQTGFRRLIIFLRIAKLEDSGLRVSTRVEADQIRIVCEIEHMKSHPFICFAEWLNLHGVISVVRSVAGPNWYPREMSFVSPYAPTEAVLKAFPHTRILVGQPNTSILVDRIQLARTTGAAMPAPDFYADSFPTDDELAEDGGQWTFASLLRQSIRPYLKDGRADLTFAAGMAGTSTRTLQRRLQLRGLSYSDVLQTARFDLACTLLENPNTKIMDVAITSGYENPQHFTRAFRRFTGVTPTTFRRNIARDTDLQVEP